MGFFNRLQVELLEATRQCLGHFFAGLSDA
jgi:hypothetical protein